MISRAEVASTNGVRRFELTADAPGDELILRALAEHFRAIGSPRLPATCRVGILRRVDLLVAAVGGDVELRPTEIARILNQPTNSIRAKLSKLLRAGRIRRRPNGTYETALPTFPV